MSERRPPGPALTPPQDVLLGPGAAFDGLAVFDGRVRIDGHLRGEVAGTGTLWVGETGRVEARVEADEVVVAGELVGQVRAGRRIELRPTARVKATLDTPSLVLAEGSFLEGRCAAGDAARDAVAIPSAS
jgi:cytoskeletal protein CcmA (bactofilin family)